MDLVVVVVEEIGGAGAEEQEEAMMATRWQCDSSSAHLVHARRHLITMDAGGSSEAPHA